MSGQGRIRKYAFINAKLRARLSNLLSDEIFSQMAKSRSLHEAIRYLHDTSFQIIEETYTKTGDLKLAELELYKKEVKIYLEVEKYVSGEVRDVVRGFTRKYEVENLKAALRLWFDRVVRKREIDSHTGYLYREKIHYDLNIDQIINVDSLETIIDILANTPYAKIIKDNAARFEQARDLFAIEIALDKYYYKHLYGKAIKLDNMDYGLLKHLLGGEIDLENISWLIRFRDFYKMTIEESMANMLPFGHHFDKKALEDLFSNDSIEVLKVTIERKYPFLSSMITQSSGGQATLILLQKLLVQINLYEVKKMKGVYPFSIGIIMAYFLLKKNEIQKILRILNAKYYNIEEERIKSVI